MFSTNIRGKHGPERYKKSILGIAPTLGCKVILIIQKTDDLKLPFDTRVIRHSFYTRDKNGLEKLYNDLKKTINDYQDKSNEQETKTTNIPSE